MSGQISISAVSMLFQNSGPLRPKNTPRLSQRSGVVASAAPLITITSTGLRPGSSRLVQTDRPSSAGILMSTIKMSGCRCRALTSNCMPLIAVSTWKPSIEQRVAS